MPFGFTLLSSASLITVPSILRISRSGKTLAIVSENVSQNAGKLFTFHLWFPFNTAPARYIARALAPELLVRVIELRLSEHRLNNGAEVSSPQARAIATAASDGGSIIGLNFTETSFDTPGSCIVTP